VQQLLQWATAFGAFPERPVRKFLDFLEFMFALFTLIFVERHAGHLQNES
jgi:hypothetical protein